MKLESVANYLEGQGYGKIGRDIFAYRMPETVARGILLTTPQTGVEINHEMPCFFKSNFMMVVRDTKIDEGLSLAATLSTVLTLEDKALDEVMVKYIRPRFEPVVFPSSKGDNFEVSVGFDASYYIL